MLRKALTATVLTLLTLAAALAGLYLWNTPPKVPPLSAAEAAQATRPYVIKLHAQWCPVCMLTKAEWSDIEKAYADRVNLVVFDSTNEAAAAASRAEADRLGLTQVIDEYHGATGMVIVLDAQTKRVVAEIAGNQAFDRYRTAIDEALGSRSPTG